MGNVIIIIIAIISGVVAGYISYNNNNNNEYMQFSKLSDTKAIQGLKPTWIILKKDWCVGVCKNSNNNIHHYVGAGSISSSYSSWGGSSFGGGK